MLEIRHPSNTQEAYDTLYDTETITQHWDSFFEWILKLLRPRPGALLVDICCGTGSLLRLARKKYHLQAMGVDFSMVAVQKAQQQGAAWVANGENLPIASNSFDYVVNLGSLEHFENMAYGVQEMARILKPDGTCCILVPNTFGLFWTIWHAKNTGEVFDDGQPIQRYGTLQQWKSLFEENGLRVQQIYPYELPPPGTPRQLAHYLRHPKMYMIKLLFWKVIPLTLSSMFVYLCSRNPQSL